MSNEIYYKGFTGTIEYCNADNLLYGRVVGVPHTYISYHGHSIEEVISAFKESIDIYLLPEADEDTTLQQIA